MSKEKSFSGIYKDVTYEDILSYKRYKKQSFLKGYSPEEIAKHLYAQENISQDKWKALKILNRKLFNKKRAEAHKLKIHSNYDYLLDGFNNRKLPDGVFSESFDKGVIACVKAKSDLPFYEQFFEEFFLKYNIDSIIDYAYTLPEDQKDMCKTLIYSAIQYYRDDHAYWYKNLSKPQYIELSDVYVNIRFKKDIWYDNDKAVDFLIEHFHDRIINASLKMEGSLAYEGKINYLRRKNPDFDAKKEKNRFKHLVALAQDKMYAFSLKQDEVENYEEISVLNTGDKNETSSSNSFGTTPAELSNKQQNEELCSSPAIDEVDIEDFKQNVDDSKHNESVQADGFLQSDVPAKEVHLDMVSKPEDPIDAKERKDRIRSKDGIDYSDQQKRNQETGDIGEKLVLANEIDKARKWGLSEDLVSQIRRVSLESDDYGFDILSFDQNGKEHYIEVKTTKASSNSLSFVLTQNELDHARKYGSAYSIVMVFDVAQNPRIWDMGNPFVREPCKVNIKPIKYLVEVNVDTIE